MTNDRPAVEIEIRDSVVMGDVVAGDKTVVVHLHEDQLRSVEAIHAALLQQGQRAAAGDMLIHALLSNPRLAERYEAAKLGRDREFVDQLVDATIREHERAGASPEMIAKLWAAIEKARKAQDWFSFSKSGTTLLCLMHGKADADDDVMRLADELVEVGRSDVLLSRNVPVARIYQATWLYHRHFAAVTELRTAMSVRQRLPVSVPMVNLLSELKRAIELSALSNAYARQALDRAFECGDPSVGIYVLFGFITLQNHHYFLYHLMLGAVDGLALAERILATARTLEELIKKFGTESDVAMIYSNTAAFSLSTREYGKAETLAFLAAQKFTSLGDANSARRALNIVESARKREPVLRPPPTDADVEAAPVEDLVAAMRRGVGEMAKLHGIDIKSAAINNAIEGGFRDFPPERVLRYCEHIVVDCSPSELGMTLGLPWIGVKTIGCPVFRKRIENTELDRGFAAFREILRCEECQHRAPRAPGWKWSIRWASEQAEERFRSGDPPVGAGYY